MSYPIVSRCSKNEYNIQNRALFISAEKYAIITDIAVAALLITVAILMKLACNGVHLGHLSGIGALGIKAVYVFAAAAGTILLIDLIYFTIRLSKHLAYLQTIQHDQVQENQHLENRIRQIELEKETLKAQIQVAGTLEELQNQLRDAQEQLEITRAQKEQLPPTPDSQITQQEAPPPSTPESPIVPPEAEAPPSTPPDTQLVQQEAQIRSLQDSIASYQKIEKELQKKTEFKNKPIPLVKLIQGSGDGELASKLSTHWLKDAATRIFPDPLRSFLELIVNGLDASVPPEKTVGKFGMGFISILGLLNHEETNGCAIRVESHAKNGENSLSSLRMDLSLSQDNNYQFILTDQPSGDETGTCITIKPKKGTFSKETLAAFLHYCMALQFYEHGKIEISHQGTTYSIGEGSETLVWVRLDQRQLIVEDKGCGITEEVACTKLFLPSSSTKNGEKKGNIDPRPPEFKKYKGKKDLLPHFIISINGVNVIDLPFTYSTSQDLVLKMPPSTRLTVGRDAVENRPESIQFLKKVIEATVQASIVSKENAIVLDALYSALKTWEAMTPSIAEAQLSTYLHQSIHKFLHESDRIPYPLEQAAALQSFLPKNEKLIPFPQDLLFGHFEPFENLLTEHYRTEHREDLIAGKSVLFTEIDKVTSLGLKNWIFAPKRLLDSEPDPKSLLLSLVTCYADEGRELEIPSEKGLSLMPPSMARMNSPRGFLFITGRDTIPLIYRWDKNFYGWEGSYWITASRDELPKIEAEQGARAPGLATRKNEKISPWMDIEELHKVFEHAEAQPFEELWNKEHKALSEYFFNTKLTSVCKEKSSLYFKYFDGLTDRHKTLDRDLKSFFFFEKTSSDDVIFFVVKDSEGIVSIIEEQMKGDQTKYCRLKEGSLEHHLESISSGQACKLMFSWLFSQMGVLKGEVNIFTDERIFWPPPQTITLEYLQSCYELLIKKRETLSRVIASRHLTTFDDQEKIWKTLEDFMAYKPYGPHAIKQILPLLLLQKEISKADLPVDLHRKFELFVQQTLSSYHKFLEIKTGAVEHTYGKDLKTVKVVDTSQFFSAGIEEIVHFLTSLKEKPKLFEKCLDFYIQELTQRMDLKKRDKTLQSNKPLYIDTISCNNGLALLSVAHSIGIDPQVIEMVLHQVATPFELYALNLLILGKYHENYFMKPIDPTNLLILTETITIYLRKSKPYGAIREYQQNFASFNSISDERSDRADITSLLWPIRNYFYATHNEAGSKDAFAEQLKAIPTPIQQRLDKGESFTSMQVIHAARAGKAFATALDKGDLSEAVAIAQTQPQESELQMISQAVEHGSERSGMQSTLVEAFQNSCDAIRGFLKQHPEADREKASISMDVRLVGSGNCNLLIQVADQIGMLNLRTLLADFLIPNYSEKGGDSVGEMGNGSYQMYREAALVTVKTRTLESPSRVYFLKVEPLRHPTSQEVIDLRHTCVDITDLEPGFVGTTLEVVMQNSHETETGVLFEGMIARNFIKETFALANPPLGANHNLECLLQYPDKPLVLAGIERKKGFKSESSPFSCYQMKEQGGHGYVLTDGYPFKPLEIFLNEEELLPAELAQEVGRGWCLNLPKGSYTPVQSRMRVHMTKEAKEALKTFLLDWIYYRSCCKESSGPKKQYYPHFESACTEFYQVYPIARAREVPKSLFTKGDFSSLESFFVHYKPSFLQKSFKANIEEVYKLYLDTLLEKRRVCTRAIKALTSENRQKEYDQLVLVFQQECRAEEAKWSTGLKSSNEYEQAFFDQVLIPWVTTKTSQFPDTIPSLEDLIRGNQKMQTPDEVEEKKTQLDTIGMTAEQQKELLESAIAILTPYCTLYAQTNGMEKPPEIAFFYEPEPIRGYYSLDSHKISLNLVYFPLSSILEMGNQVLSKNPLKENPLISVSYMSSGVLNHELEHARRKDSCSGNGHERMEINGKSLDFEACAAHSAKKAHMDGLFVKWAEKLGGIAFPHPDLLAKLLEIEKTFPEALLER